MPIELQVIRASDFVCFDAGNQIDFEKSKNILEELAVLCRKRGVDRAMIDLRDLPVPEKPRMTNVELATLVGAFRAAGFSRHQRLALLYRYDVFGNIRNFTFFSRMRGIQVQAFEEFEPAIRWLWQETGVPAEHEPGTEVPILRHEEREQPVKLASRRRRGTTPRTPRKYKRH